MPSFMGQQLFKGENTMSERPTFETAQELNTMNLISVYQDNNLSARLDAADRYELENIILARVGIRDA